MLVDPFFCFFPLFLKLFLLLFVTKKEGKTCLNAEKDDFDQFMACTAPVLWSKYTKKCHIILMKLTLFTDDHEPCFEWGECIDGQEDVGLLTLGMTPVETQDGLMTL